MNGNAELGKAWTAGIKAPSRWRAYGLLEVGAGMGCVAMACVSMCEVATLGVGGVAGAVALAALARSAAELAGYLRDAASKRDAWSAAGKGMSLNLQAHVGGFATVALAFAKALGMGGRASKAMAGWIEGIEKWELEGFRKKVQIQDALYRTEYGSWARVCALTASYSFGEACKAWLAKPFNPAWLVPSGLEDVGEGAVKFLPAPEMGDDPHKIAGERTFAETIKGVLSLRDSWGGMDEEDAWLCEQAMVQMERMEILGLVGECVGKRSEKKMRL